MGIALGLAAALCWGLSDCCATVAARRGSVVPTVLAFHVLSTVVLAVAALVIPAWTLVSWYRDLARAREVATRMAIQAEPIVDRAVVNGAALLCLGFLVMIGGIWLARRVP